MSKDNKGFLAAIAFIILAAVLLGTCIAFGLEPIKAQAPVTERYCESIGGTVEDGECVIVTVERIPLEDLEDEVPDVKGCNVYKTSNGMVYRGFTTTPKCSTDDPDFIDWVYGFE